MDLQPPKTSLHDILNDPTIPTWKKDLIVRKRNTNRILFGNLKFTCASSSALSQSPTTTTVIRKSTDDECSGSNVSHQQDFAGATVYCSSSDDENFTVNSTKKSVDEEEDFHLITPLLQSPQPLNTTSSAQVNGDIISGEGICSSSSCATVVANNVSVTEAGSHGSQHHAAVVSTEMRLNDNLQVQTTSTNNNNSEISATTNNNHHHHRSKNHKNSNYKKLRTSGLLTSMGEEKIKMKNSTRKLSAPNSPSPKEVINMVDSEEIKYGPGIVHKLRDRYINITLREAASNTYKRPPLSNLRRASSLDNILDDAPSRRGSKEDSPPPVASSNKSVPRYVKHKPELRGTNNVNRQESLKRVRSMETLTSFDEKPVRPLVNDNIVIIEQTKPVVSVSRKRNSSGSVPSEDELPPPDFVRQTRQKFERRTSPPVSNFIKKPALSPKPNLPVSTKENNKPPTPTVKATMPLPVVKIEKKKLSSPPIDKKSEKPQIKQVSLIPKTKSPSPPPPQLPLSPPPVQTNGNDIELEENTKIISEKALENIRKNGFSFEIKPARTSPNNLSHLPMTPQVISIQQKDKQTNSGDASPKQVGIIRPITKPTVVDEKNLINSVKSEKPATNLILKPEIKPTPSYVAPPNFARPIPTSPTVKERNVSVSPPTVKERSVSVSPPTVRERNVSLSPPNVLPVAVSPPNVLPVKQTNELWGNKRHFNDQGSTQTFDFTARKTPIPDYIENDGVIRTVSDKDDVTDTGPASPVRPVEVIGGNVLINGRSNIRTKPKTNKVGTFFFFFASTKLFTAHFG
ncbi:hypothetical protein B566_EDAN009381 [Ephemera danica]|nr:hypothetical protein B566_EDAN009381 [Ephemera danica]